MASTWREFPSAVDHVQVMALDGLAGPRRHVERQLPERHLLAVLDEPDAQEPPARGETERERLASRGARRIASANRFPRTSRHSGSRAMKTAAGTVLENGLEVGQPLPGELVRPDRLLPAPLRRPICRIRKNSVPAIRSRPASSATRIRRIVDAYPASCAPEVLVRLPDHRRGDGAGCAAGHPASRFRPRTAAAPSEPDARRRRGRRPPARCAPRAAPRARPPALLFRVAGDELPDRGQLGPGPDPVAPDGPAVDWVEAEGEPEDLARSPLDPDPERR